MFQNLPKLPLRPLLIVPFSLQILAAVGLTGALSLRNGQQLVQDLAGQLSAQTSEQITKHVQHYLDTSELMLQVNQVAVQTGSLDLENFEQLQQYFWQQSQLSTSVTTLYYGAANGDFLQVEMGAEPTLALRTPATAPQWEIFRLDDQGDRQERLRTGLYDPRQRPWYKKATKMESLTWSAVYLFADPPVLGITPALPIYQTDGRLQGVMAIDLPLSQLSEFLASLEIGQTGTAFIMESDGTLIASSVAESMVHSTATGEQARRTLPQSQDPVLQAVATHWANSAQMGQIRPGYQKVIQDKQGQRYFFYLTTIDSHHGIDWRLGIMIPQRDFQAAFDRNRRTTVVVCTIALLVSAGFGIVMTSLLVQPLGRLVQASQAIATGDFEATLPEGKIRELDRLSRAFGRMRTQLQDAFANWAATHQTLAESAQRRAAALQLSEERFTKVFQASPDAIAICAFETGRILEVNDSFLAATGYTATDVIDRTLTELDLWRIPGQTDEIVEVAHAQGSLSNQLVTFTNATGKLRWAKLAAETIAIKGQLCLVFMTHDITALKAVEAELQQQKQYLWLILNNIPQQVFWKDTQSVFVGCNRNWAIASGLDSPEQVIGKTDYELVSSEAAERYRAEDAYVMQNDQPILHQLDIKHKSQDAEAVVWLDVTKIPLHDEAGEVIGLIGVLEDITQRKQATEALKAEQAKSEQLLLNILPQAIAQQLKHQQTQNLSPSQRNLLAQHYDQVTILFADIVGFTSLCATLPPIELVTLLNDIFSAFDRLADQYGLEKIKTIGDAYMVAAGLPTPRPDQVVAIAQMALAMQAVIPQIQTPTAVTCQIRLGIHTGPVVAGVIGLKKFSYDLWGDTVNIASRMETTGEPGRIQVTEAVYQALQNSDYAFTERGWVDVKGKGQMRTYWLNSKF
ncbi:MAG: PAS domain S-box protein [Spirulina sp. SIO3F2]|nr:PAS domain S-box protein [Spirulina sp. SIO3F2]